MAHQDETEAPARPSLYDRLGGVYNIAPVVDDLIDRVMVDPRLNANPRVDEAHHRVSAAGFKYFVTEMLCQAAGGPQQYSGRSMGDSHRHLMITDEEWLAFMDDLQQTLDKFGVPQPEQNEIKVIVESTREAIVLAPLQDWCCEDSPLLTQSGSTRHRASKRVGRLVSSPSWRGWQPESGRSPTRFPCSLGAISRHYLPLH